MIYYTYRVGYKSYSLNENEHRQIVDIIRAGKTGLVVLREGKLIINLSFIRTVVLDEESMRWEAQNKQNMEKLPHRAADADKQRRERIRKQLAAIRAELTEKLGWKPKGA